MGWIFLGLVVAGFVAMNFVMKLGSMKGYSSPALTGSLFAAAAIFCLVALIISGKPLFISIPVVLLAVGGGVGGAVAYFFFLSALKIGPYAMTISIYTMAFLVPVGFSIVVWFRPLGASTAAGIASYAQAVSWPGAAIAWTPANSATPVTGPRRVPARTGRDCQWRSSGRSWASRVPAGFAIFGREETLANSPADSLR